MTKPITYDETEAEIVRIFGDPDNWPTAPLTSRTRAALVVPRLSPALARACQKARVAVRDASDEDEAARLRGHLETLGARIVDYLCGGVDEESLIVAALESVAE